MVVSDWGGTHSTVGSAMAGLDVEMGSSEFFTKALLDSAKKGLIPESVINDKVKTNSQGLVFHPAERSSAGREGIHTGTHEDGI